MGYCLCRRLMALGYHKYVKYRHVLIFPAFPFYSKNVLFHSCCCYALIQMSFTFFFTFSLRCLVKKTHTTNKTQTHKNKPKSHNQTKLFMSQLQRKTCLYKVLLSLRHEYTYLLITRKRLNFSSPQDMNSS